MAWQSEPLAGDLARLGGYRETEFGWNGLEEQFTPPLAKAGALDGTYSVVVIGDSFSSRTSPDRQTRDGSFWTDFLANDSGLSVGVFDVATTSIARFLASDAYRLHPPRLLVLEIAERTLQERLAGPVDCPAPGEWLRPNVRRVPDPLVPGAFTRRRVMRSAEQTVDQLADHLRKTLLRMLLGGRATPVLRLKLTRADLFTSARAGELLAYADDRDKANWTDQDWREIRCRLLRDQREVMANGRTSFLFLLAPDKSSAYAAYLPPAPWLIESAARLALPRGLAMPRIDLALRAAIRAGVRDVYLPDDTHWSTAGARIVERTVLNYVRPPAEPPYPADLTASR